MTIAEESTAFPGVTQPAHLGGLGFHFKWNMGWMNDTLRYMALDPVHRRYEHQLDDVLVHVCVVGEIHAAGLARRSRARQSVHCSAKMPGDEWQKLANYRLLLAYMTVHPGKKLHVHGRANSASGANGATTRTRSTGTCSTTRGTVHLHGPGIATLNRMYADISALHGGDSRSAQGFAGWNCTTRTRACSRSCAGDPARPEMPPVVCAVQCDAGASRRLL